MKCEHPNRFNGVLVPCGRCVACRSTYSENIVARLLTEEELIKEGGLYMTGTLNDEALPPDLSLDNTLPGVYIRRCQAVFRKHHLRPHFKYLAAGEYGEQKERPHYHFIVIGIEPTEENIKVFRNTWENHTHGSFIQIRPLWTDNPLAGISYVASYVAKSSPKWKVLPGETVAQFYKRVGRRPEFLTWSKGLGKTWLHKNLDKVLQLGYLKLGPYQFALPRYYMKEIKKVVSLEQYKLLLSKHKRYLEGLCAQRSEDTSVFVKDLFSVNTDTLAEALYEYRNLEKVYKDIFNEEWKFFLKLQKTDNDHLQPLPANFKYNFYSKTKQICLFTIDKAIGKRDYLVALGPLLKDRFYGFNGCTYPELFIFLVDKLKLLVGNFTGGVDFISKVFYRFAASESCRNFTHLITSQYVVDNIMRWNRVQKQVQEVFKDRCIQSAKNKRRFLELKYNKKL